MTETLMPADTLLWNALPDLTLNIAQTATLCGISVRQLGYWTQQGYVTASGRGSRRTYGLEAVRRVLAISKMLEGGASLQQALRQISTEPALSLPPAASPSPAALPAMSLEKADALAHALRGFFQANQQTRDSAAGLAVKMGRSEEELGIVAEQLCVVGILVKTVCQGLSVFRQPEAAHV